MLIQGKRYGKTFASIRNVPVYNSMKVFEKFEKPYRREGAGLTLAALYLEEDTVLSDVLLDLVKSSQSATEVFSRDSIAGQ